MEDFEDYVKNILKIPYCNFDGIDPRIAYEIIVGFELMYEMYPFFNRVICSIGGVEEYNNHINMLDYSNINNKFGRIPKYYELKNDNNATYALGMFIHPIFFQYRLPLIINKNFNDYFSIIIYDNVKKVNISDVKNLCNTYSGRINIYHEFAHLLDKFLHISNSYEFFKIVRGHDITNEVSYYATFSDSELLAEAFSRYIYSKKKLTNLEKKLGRTEFSNIDYEANDLIMKIGELVDSRYEKFVKYRQFEFIKNRYNFNKRFTIDKSVKLYNSEKIMEIMKKL